MTIQRKKIEKFSKNFQNFKLFYGSLKLSFTPSTFRSQISWSPW
eukprot:UN18074